jgi:uncharacterized protein YjbI with pentapeptide repeats
VSQSPTQQHPADITDITLSAPLQQKVEAVLQQKTADFRAMTEAAGLDPAHSFRGKTLRNIDFGTSNLWGFDFTGADLSGSDFSQAKTQGACFVGATLDDALGYRIDAQTLMADKLRSGLNPEDQAALVDAQSLLKASASLLKQGHSTEALKGAEEAANIFAQLLPEEDPSLVAARLLLQDALAAAGEQTAALEHADSTYQTCLRTFGEANPLSLAAARSLARNLIANQRAEEAVSFSRKSSEMHDRYLGVTHPDSLESLEILANAFDALGEHDVADLTRLELLSTYKDIYGPQHLRTSRLKEYINRNKKISTNFFGSNFNNFRF